MTKTASAAIFSLVAFYLFSCAQVKEPGVSPDDNNDIHHAASISSFPTTLSELIDNPADEDFYRIDASANKRIYINMSAPAGKDYDLFFLNSDESVIDSSTNGLSASKLVLHTLTQSGTYYVKIVSSNGSYSSGQKYRLTVHLTDTAGTAGFSSPHLALGNPSKAVSVVDSLRNYLMDKSQYALSYNSSTGRPNWVSWQTNNAWLGSVTRQEDFRADASLPPAWYHLNENDFSGSGYDRGHMCPSGDRTVTESDNSETFLMSNMIAQAPDNNQGPWAALENYCRSLVAEGKELFIISGGYGSSGTLAGEKVTIPARTWKVIVVLDVPGTGLSGVTNITRVIGVDLPNRNDIRGDNWKNYRVSVDQIETATGYDFLSNVSASVQSVIESTVDDK